MHRGTLPLSHTSLYVNSHTAINGEANLQERKRVSVQNVHNFTTSPDTAQTFWIGSTSFMLMESGILMDNALFEMLDVDRYIAFTL